jgi:hypothetical protein
MFLDHTQRRTTVGRTPLDEWSACRRDLYLTVHDAHNRQGNLTFWIAPVHIHSTCTSARDKSGNEHTYSGKDSNEVRLTSSGINTNISKKNSAWIIRVELCSIMMEHVPPECQCLCTWLHRIISQKATFTASATIIQTVMWPGKWCGFHYFIVVCPNCMHSGKENSAKVCIGSYSKVSLYAHTDTRWIS